MTEAQERARITRQRNKEARDKFWNEYHDMEKKDRAAAVEAMRRVRDDEASSPEQRLEAIKIIAYNMNYRHIPLDIKCPQTGTDGAIETE